MGLPTMMINHGHELEHIHIYYSDEPTVNTVGLRPFDWQLSHSVYSDGGAISSNILL